MAPAGYDEAAKPKYSIKFGVIGLDHYHIMGMTAAIIRGGVKLPVSFYTNLPKAVAHFQKVYPNAKLAGSEDEILNDRSIALISAAPIPDLRAPLGIRAMRHGKDFLWISPASSTLEQLAGSAQDHLPRPGKYVRHLVFRTPGGEGGGAGRHLVKAGAIGKVVQTDEHLHLTR